MEWMMASSVATRAMCLWNKLKVENWKPVNQRKTLLRPLNIQRRGKLAYEAIPVRSAMYRQVCSLGADQLDGY